jgi:hypothetical protein
MRRSEPLTVERVTVATRTDAMLLSTSPLDGHKSPISGDALDVAVAGLLDGTDRGVLLLACQDRSAVSAAALTLSWALEHGGAAAMPSSERGRGLLRQTHPIAAQDGRGRHNGGPRK